MERALRDLINARLSNFKPSDSSIVTHGFSLLGMSDSVPEIGKYNSDVHIWHVPKGILPITSGEFTRWDLDSPRGFHWILSERPLHIDLIQAEQKNVEIWGPVEISMFIGRGVMDGDLVAKSPIKKMEQTSTFLDEAHSKKQTQFLRPVVDIGTWKTQRGMEHLSSTPILLEGRIWRVEGEIIGPKDEIEFGIWDLFEDPWSSTIVEMNDTLDLTEAPDLRIFPPPNDSWLSHDVLISEAARILDVRRRTNSQNPGKKDAVRSMLLQRWRFNKDSARCESSPMHISGWLVHSERESILHGINGRLYET